MVGSGLKKLAAEKGLNSAHGVIYGNLCGYAVTLFEERGGIEMVITAHFAEPQKQEVLQNMLKQKEIWKKYRFTAVAVGDGIITVQFNQYGYKKRIRAFIDWLFPLLEPYYSAVGIKVCPTCGGEMDNGKWVLINGIAFFLHDSCSQRMQRDAEDEQKEERPGSYLTGALGAFLGATLGAVVWAVVLAIGYLASIVGFLIGWFSDFGYNLLHGKQGKGKMFILILAVIFGVLLGTFVPEAFSIFHMIQDRELPGFTTADIPALITYLLQTDAEYRGAIIYNILMGLLFAALGVYVLLKKTKQQVFGPKFIEL